MPVINWNFLESQKITIGTVIVCGLAFLWLRGWMGDTFFTRVEAAEHNRQVTAEISDNTEMLGALTKEIRVNAAYGWVGTLEAKVYAMKRDGVGDELLEAEKSRLGRATDYRDCLMDNAPNCELLAKQIK